MNRYNLAILILFSLCSSISCAENYENINDIKKITKDFITKNVEIEPEESIDIKINSSDLPTQLAQCTKKIEIKFPKESSREKINSVELTCDGEKMWHTFIPVNVQIYTKVVIAKHMLDTNETISKSDIDYSQANINHLYNGYFKNKKEVEGRITTQIINAGTIISKRNVRQPQLVHRNQEIELVAKINSVEVMMKGIAKSDGGLNDTITAYNPSSKKMLEATVVGFNRAEVIS